MATRKKLIDLQAKRSDGKTRYAIVSGYGYYQGQCAVAAVQKITPRRVYTAVRFPGMQLSMDEAFDRRTGVRIGDEGEEDGWKIAISDLTTEYVNNVDSPEVREESGFFLVNQEVLSNSDHNTVVTEIWSGPDGEQYVRTYREARNPDTGALRQLPATVPLEDLLAIVFDYESK